MQIVLGEIEALFRYPVKSMRGEAVEHAEVGWHGFDGDRRFAVRRTTERGEFPWLTASKLHALVCYAPVRRDGDGTAPTHVRTPDGAELPIFGEALAAEIGGRYGAPVEIMQLKHGVFDEGSISVITSTTANEITRLAGMPADLRRFRPNIVVRSLAATPFEEDAWVGGTIVFGDDAAAITVTLRDERCAMVNLDPDDASVAPAMMKAAVRANQNHAGVYATVTRRGRVEVGQRVVLHRSA